MNNFIKLFTLILLASFTFSCSKLQKQESKMMSLEVSQNQKFLQYENGEPFFWLGDTGWLLFQKLNREEAVHYLDDRKAKGFNVIHVMILNDLGKKNFYGDLPFINDNPAQPLVTKGQSFENDEEYDYWDHIEYILDLAEERNIYLALVPIWGGAAKKVSAEKDWAKKYALWLAERFKTRNNIIWLNGGDLRGDIIPDVWQQIGSTLDKNTNQLITFHPFGRTQSSTWFHDKAWLDFNMFQSGHRRYDQIGNSDDTANWKGEDNWRFVLEDLSKLPPKPTIDGEPSYENIPQGLHDPIEPYWTAADARRYAYWSVFAGAFGHTYGNNAVMQMHKPTDSKGAYGVRNFWYEAVNDSGAGQMHHLKDLILSYPYFERVNDQSLVTDNGIKYEYVIATRGKDYALFYTFIGRSFKVKLENFEAEKISAKWFNPRNGEISQAKGYENISITEFDPPGKKSPGNDWVLILESDE